jgi:nucleolar protein 58
MTTFSKDLLHFPWAIFCIIVTPSYRYSKVVLAMGTREKAAATDFSTFLDDDTEHALKETAAVSMGTEISGEDLSNMQALARQCVELSQYRHALFL